MPDDTPRPDDDLAPALAAWTALAPPAGFAERVLDGRDAITPPPRRRWRLVGIALAVAAAAVAAVALWPADRAASGALVATGRTTARLGDRGLAVAEPAAELTWRIDARGAADVVQRAGDVFYRVERGEPFVVHTPAGDVRVTGTCFRVEVEPMKTNHKLLLAGLAGAALATTVLVTVYEGHVIAETRAAKAELAAGAHATLGGPDGATIVASSDRSGEPDALTPDDAHATRAQLLARAQQQQAQLRQLRARLAQLERGSATLDPTDPDRANAEPGRMWHDPSPETLAAWVAECRIRVDEPSLERFTPLAETDRDHGLEPGELDGYNATMTELAGQWKALVRKLYVEITGDTAGAEMLSTEAMRHEIEDKSPPDEHNLVLQRISRERAGLAAAPTDLGKASALERMMRAYAALGDQTEASLARRFGAARARALRGDGWSSRSDQGGCPSAAR